ncbi:retrovirus-related Pol polyprotein from transposon 17.6 [Trichonephila clavipes]|nr:retrovirus-related Pol polyprotein from transposon 17.6 [Trichonephila clavipes]
MIKKKAPLKLVPVIQEVFIKLNIDACGPLPITSKGNRYLITAICMSSKFPEAIPVSDISSVSVTDALLNIFSRMVFPREIQCDRRLRMGQTSSVNSFSVTNCISRKYRVQYPGHTVRIGAWEKFANPRDVSNGTLDGTGRRG